MCQPNGFCTFADGTCASGQRYEDRSGANSGVCVGEEPIPGEAGAEAGDPQPFCIGDPSGVRVCFATRPTGDMSLPAAIDTDSTTACMTPMSGGGGYCVIAAERLRGDILVAVTGTKPLVLVATTTIEISGTLDAASHRGNTPPNYATAQTGAGSDPAGGCSPPGTPGNNAGGAGGTLVDLGGTGGNGGGAPGAAQTITTVRGGCRGQNGNTGNAGLGGHGGGAVYLIADTITISGQINASGEGGHPGIAGDAGGGGGGSGGFIGLDAQTITNTGVVYANGASGGEGSGNVGTGSPGPEPNSAAASPGSPSFSVGGNGGSGGAGGSMAGAATGGTGENSGGAGGGGGGGGTGVIKVYRGTLIGQFSPTPTP